MGENRASIFSDDDDLSGFQPRKPVPQDVTAVKQAADITGFKSREPRAAPAAVAAPVPVRPPQRRHRTGRNAQLNLKAKPETIAAFTAVADAEGWVLGEAFEKAVELLRHKYSKSGSK